MSLMRKSLRDAEKALADQLSRRERLLKESRDVISLCSRSIIDVHHGKLESAEAGLKAARTGAASLRGVAEGNLARYLVSPETELVEATTVLALVTKKPVPSRESIGTSPEAYLLGLLDAVGELKRLVLDSVGTGDISEARRHYSSMEELYSACSPLAVYDHVANGARRKIDVARMLVEDTRGILTEEARREAVISSIEGLQKTLRSRRRG